MDSQQTFSRLLEQLGYETSPNFVSRVTPNERIPSELELIWRETKDKLQVDAIYFVANAPVIYFKRFEAFDREIIAELHRKIWNQGQVPLIFVILPNDIRIYNGYDAPKRDATAGLNEPSRLDNRVSSSEDMWKRLENFTQLAIESGSFWREYAHFFQKETRADQQLIANLRYIRRQMIEETNLSPEHTHSLIGRSIFAFYLQDRGVLPVGEQGFFAQTFHGSYTRYTDLLTSYEDTYTFFEILHKHFNGDMFPVTQAEKEAIDEEHLKMLQKLFTVNSQVGGQLLFFWAYNFAFIPIELISSIYEEFLHNEESGKDGAYYTPPMLVDFILNQVMPWSDLNYKVCLLDPACGSGIFLVEAYRRLVERWRKVHGKGKKLSFMVLSEILTTSIFGVDVKRQALRVAAFSLYLAMLDYLEPKSIWVEVIFPTLIGSNLIVADFFDEQVQFGGKLFDLVVGNPPWKSSLTFHAKSFLRTRKLKVGDKQIVQAFLWHAPDFCAPNGQIALLCSSKSLLFNQSGPNIAFRHDFFRRFNIRTVFDLSALRRLLFEKGVAPAAAIFYTSQHPNSHAKIFYGAPKLTYLARLLSAMVIEANDLKQLPLQQILDNVSTMRNKSYQVSVKQEPLFMDDDEEDEEEPETSSINIWKVALWGTSRDYTLLRVLNNYPSLREVIEKFGWDSGSGFIRVGPGEAKRFPWLNNAPFLEAKDLTRYGIDKNKLKRLGKDDLYHRGRIPERFKGPLVLFKRGQAQRRPSAAYIDQACTYTNSITGISGTDPNLLKAITALLNSELAQYYLFLTSSSWGVEREEIKAGEMRTLPVPFLENKGKIDIIADLVDQLALLMTNTHEKKNRHGLWAAFYEDKESQVKELERKLNDLIYQCFQLDEWDVQLIQETVSQTIAFFNSPENSLAQQKPTIEMQSIYAESYIKLLNFYLEPVGRKLTATIYSEGEDVLQLPLLTVQFSSTKLEERVPDIQVTQPSEQMRYVLLGLNRSSSERYSRRMYHRRNFRIYDRARDTLSIVKPAEQRLWTTTAALNDAEETVAELSQAMKV